MIARQIFRPLPGLARRDPTRPHVEVTKGDQPIHIARAAKGPAIPMEIEGRDPEAKLTVLEVLLVSI